VRPLGLRLLAAGVAVVTLVACGGGSPSRPTTNDGRRTATGLATTADGHYVVTLAVGGTPSVGGDTTCSPPAAAGRVRLPVALTVRSSGTAETVAFPPVRVELVTGDRREQVALAGLGGGACSFTPRVAEVRPRTSVVFVGSTPEIDARAAPGTAGRVEVGISENTFSLMLPIP
jgi:hypothetical protein